MWGWAFYDFANSAFPTALAGVIFSVYFVQVVVGPEGMPFGDGAISGSSVWGYLVSASMLLVAVSAPVLGAIADLAGSRKRFLFLFCYAGVAATAFLFLVGPGDIWLAIIFYLLSSACLEWSLAFYNSFLPEITTRQQMGRISGFGWALGYVGGVLCLILTMIMIRWPEWLAIPNSDYLPVRATALLVALWWGLFSIPTFLWLRESAPVQELPPGTSYLRVGFKRLLHTLRKIHQFRELVKFLIAFLIYNDGVQTVIVMAAIFGAEVLGMSQDELIACFILIHVVAIVGSLALGHLGDRMTTKRAINITLLIWTFAVGYVLVIEESWEFWVLAGIVGFVLGGVQASSRALLAQFTPKENSAEFFGFFATGGKFAAILGPALFALIADMTGSVRYGVASVLVFFVLGWGLLYFVDEEKGILESHNSVE
ncbi:MAG: MFS transporter [Acidobacteriota bacterium]